MTWLILVINAQGEKRDATASAKTTKPGLRQVLKYSRLGADGHLQSIAENLITYADDVNNRNTIWASLVLAHIF